MKRLIFFFLLFFVVATTAKAQLGTNYITLKGGLTRKDGQTATISFDYNTKYFHQNEIFFSYYHSTAHRVLSPDSTFHMVLSVFYFTVLGGEYLELN